MKKKYLYIIGFLLTSTSSLFAQNIDSLQKELSKAKEDTNKVNLLIGICKQTGTIDDSKKEVYGETALQLSTKLNYRKGMIMSRVALGACLSSLGNYDKALKYVNEALKIALVTPEDKRTLADIYNIIAVDYYYKGDYTTALPFFMKSSTLYAAIGKKGRVANVEYNIALIYFENKDYVKAVEYTQKAINIYKLLNENVMMANATSQLGNISVAMKNYEMALLYFKQSLQLTEKLEDKSYSLTNLTGIGNVLHQTKKYKEALIYHKKALEVGKEINDLRSIATILINLGSDYFYLGKISESITCLNQAVGLSKKIGTKKLTIDAYSLLSKVYEKENNFKESLKYNKLYLGLNDSIYNEENAEQINGFSAKYESEKKEKEIALLNLDILTKENDKETLNVQVAKKNNIVYTTILCALFLTIAVFLFFRWRQLKQKNKYQAEINEHQKNNAIAIIKEQEKERNRIAKDLHDSVGTFLSTLKINLQLLEDSVSVEKIASYHNVIELADKTSVELRNITKNISSETLIESGLTEALEELVDSVNRIGTVHLEFITHGITTRLEEIIEVNLYRVAQELVNNCVKHSRADKATLQLIAHEDNILLMMEDNGKGFDVHSSNKEDNKGGMGFKNIYDRISFIKGTVKFESNPGKGTTVMIETPKHLY